MRKFERDYRVDRRTPFLKAENAFRQDVDLRLDALEGKGGLIDVAAREARDRIIRFAGEEISPLAAAMQQIVSEYTGLTEPIRDAAVAILRGGVEERGDTLAKLLDLIDAAGVDIAALLAAFALKAPLASPNFSGIPTAPTAAPGANTTQIASAAFVHAAISVLLAKIVGDAPGGLDTLTKLAAAIGDDEDFAATMTAALAARLRVDAAQSLDAVEIAQARANIDLSPMSGVRQTVCAGPVDASGLPTLFPASSGTLSISTQIVDAAHPFVVSAARGFNQYGALNAVWREASNVSWTGLTASSTLYLYVNASDGSRGFTTLAPIYQPGGAPSTANGQFTFNIAEMKGYMGDGAAAPETPLVFVGEVVTDGTGVTSSIAYAYNGYYDSGFTATLPSPGTQVSRNSNLGGRHGVQVKGVIECIAAEHGYNVGDQLEPQSGYYYRFSIAWSRNTVGFNCNGWSQTHKTNGGDVSLTRANWKYTFIANRRW